MMNRKNLAFTALCMGFFMVILDVTIVNVVLPTIAHALKTTLSGLQWVVDGYTLSFAGFLLLVGEFSDRFGAKIIFQIGLLSFILSSLACALSLSITELIFFRFIQGAAGALLLPSSLALIMGLYQDAKDKAKAIGIWGSLGGLACASGPFLGGTLASLFSWRSIFLVNVVIGLISFFLVSKTIERPQVIHLIQRKFDFLGLLSGVVSISLFSYGLIEVSLYSWNSPIIIFCFIASFLGLILFLWIESHVSHPVLPLGLFQNKTTAIALSVSFLLNLAFYGELFMMPFYFENYRHYSVFMTGLAILPIPALALIGSYLGGKMTASKGPGSTLVIGFLIAALSLFSLLFLIKETSLLYVWLLIPFLTLGFGLSFATPAMTFAAIHSVDPARSGIASAVLNTGNQVGSLIGVAAFGTIAAISSHFMLAMHLTLFLAGALLLIAAFLSLTIINEK